MKELFWHYYWMLYEKSGLFRELRHFYKYVLKINPYLQAFIVIVFIFLAVYSKHKKYKFHKGLALSVTIPYVMALFSSLVISREHNAEYLYSFKLFWNLEYVFAGHMGYIKEMVLNLFMLAPIGFLCPILLKKNKWRVIPIGIVITVSLELLQLITKTGTCELDDVIYNTVGLLIGYGLYCLIAAIKRRNNKKTGEKENV